jgi:hypothetical protein
MAADRRKALAAVCLAILGAFPGFAHAAPGGGGLVVEMDGEGSKPRIINHEHVEIDIALAIRVERHDVDRWAPIPTEFNAVSACVRGARRPFVRLAPGEVLTVAPWRGYSCSGQCNQICRTNAYYGPGEFRFVVSRWPSGERVAGPPFALAPRRPGG